MEKEVQKRINRNNRKRGGAFEKVTADFLGMEVVPYSGSNARFGYGDVRNELWLGECKNITPEDGKITIQDKWFRKNFERAAGVGKMPFLAWMPAGRPTKYIILDYSTFSRFQYTVTNHVELPHKVHNTKNLIFHLGDGYFNIMRADSGVISIRLDGCDELWYMMRMELFKMLITTYVEGMNNYENTNM